MKKIEIYTTNYCPFCVKAKSLLNKKKIKFSEIDVSNDEALREKMSAMASGARSVPQINETYPGIKGSTQGDTKLIKPAKKAIESDTIIKLFTRDLVIYLTFFLVLIYEFYHNRQYEHCQQIFEEQTLRRLP